MPQDRFLIAPLNSGLQNDTRPWLIPDDAYATFRNAYNFRSRVRKRVGSEFMEGTTTPLPGFEQLQSRLRINIGTTNGSGNISVVVPGAVFKIGQMFPIGTTMFTVYQTGTPAAMLQTDPAVTLATYNTTTGAVVINGAAINTIVYFYPAEPVMGFELYESQPVNDEPTFAWDTQFAYQYTINGWERLSAEATPGAATWTGTNTNFFWASTYKGNTSDARILYATNYRAADKIRYWDGTQWNVFNPDIDNAGNKLITARIILPYQDRLIALNTIEDTSAGPNPGTFVNRCRFSQNGSPLEANAWNQKIPGKGSFIDCPTAEGIVTAEFVKDRLIVYFERSTWELAYTGNQILPFVWQQLNTELGAESTFSVVPFDKFALGVGNVGIVACNGSNVERIDEKIPNEVFKIKNGSDGVQRVYGVRDYELEMVYWTFPSGSTDNVYPNRILAYNYRNQSWAFFDDSITAFGYYQLVSGITWGSATMTWDQAEFVWNSGAYQSKALNVVAGNQEGYTFIMRPDSPRNAPGLQISNISLTSTNATLTIIDNNLEYGDYILIESAQGVTNFNGLIFQVQGGVTNTQVPIVAQANLPFSGTYTGGGVVTRVSQIDIWTKQYNFYLSQGRNAAVNMVDFLVDRTANGQLTIDAFASSSDFSLVQSGAATGALIGTNVLETTPYLIYPFEQFQDRLWHRIFLQAEGECIQFRIYLDDEQMRNTLIALSDFELHAFCVFTQVTSNRLQ